MQFRFPNERQVDNTMTLGNARSALKSKASFDMAYMAAAPQSHFVNQIDYQPHINKRNDSLGFLPPPNTYSEIKHHVNQNITLSVRKIERHPVDSGSRIYFQNEKGHHNPIIEDDFGMVNAVPSQPQYQSLKDLHNYQQEVRLISIGDQQNESTLKPPVPKLKGPSPPSAFLTD